jgi:hypothetical protein
LTHHWKKIVAATLAASVCACFVTVSRAQDEEAPKPKHTIKEVMKAHKGGLLKKLVAGEGTAEEKKMFLDMSISLLEAKPPKGEMNSWQKLAGGQALAAAKLVVGREGAEDELKKATNCAACHKPHKP